ncbi:MAG: hypothetical protein V8S95_10945 [Odoribacter sp.]
MTLPTAATADRVVADPAGKYCTRRWRWAVGPVCRQIYTPASRALLIKIRRRVLMQCTFTDQFQSIMFGTRIGLRLSLRH